MAEQIDVCYTFPMRLMALSGRGRRLDEGMDRSAGERARLARGLRNGRVSEFIAGDSTQT